MFKVQHTATAWPLSPASLQFRSEVGGLVQESCVEERLAVLAVEACLFKDSNSNLAKGFGSMDGFHDHAEWLSRTERSQL
jgi:hypothetical protein